MEKNTANILLRTIRDHFRQTAFQTQHRGRCDDTDSNKREDGRHTQRKAGMYPRISVPRGDFADCTCKRGRGAMNVFSLFMVNGERVCDPYSARKEPEFKANIRPLFPGAPQPTGNGRSNRDQAPS